MPSVANGVQADTTYSNFGSTPPTFNKDLGYGVTGSLAGGPGTFGAEFAVPGVGNAIVTGADVALQRILTLGSNGVVDASFWTVSAGLPGTQVGGSFAATATDNFPPEVASLSISGVTLTGGQSYFLILTQFGSLKSTHGFLLAVLRLGRCLRPGAATARSTGRRLPSSSPVSRRRPEGKSCGVSTGPISSPLPSPTLT